MLVLVWICTFLWFFYDALSPMVLPLLENHAILSRLLALIEIFLFAALSIPFTETLNHTMAAYAKRPPREGLPRLAASGFILLVVLVHYAAWVPPSLAAILASPLLFLPPLTYFVTSPSATKKTPPLFTTEETCKMLDNLPFSGLLCEFLERYPKAHAYLYKKKLPHTSGGLFLHHRERFPVPNPTYLEITLDCPFTTKPGEFALGRETFHAYFSRPHKNGISIHPLPPNTWEEWLTGQTTKEWMTQLEELDELPPSFPHLDNLPYQLHTKMTPWQTFSLL